MSAAAATATTTPTTANASAAEMPEVSTTMARESQHTVETIKTPNGDTIFSSSTATASSSSTTTTTQTSVDWKTAAGTPNSNNNNNASNNNEKSAINNVVERTVSDENANATTATTITTTTTNGEKANGINSVEDLKIVGHLKSIEQINEKRRLFLSNTISEYNTITTTTAAATTTSSADLSKVEKSKNNNNNNDNNNTNTNTDNQKAANQSAVVGEETKVEVEINSYNSNSNNGNNSNNNYNNSDNLNNNKSNVGNVENGKAPHLATPDDFNLTPTMPVVRTPSPSTLPTTPPPTPKSPPPKPPMLSRTRSLNRGPSLTSPPLASTPTAAAAAATVTETEEERATTPTSTVTITSSVVPEPLRVETIELRELQAPKAMEPKVEVKAVAAPKSPISPTHSQRLEHKEEKSLLRKVAEFIHVPVPAPHSPVPATAPAQPAAAKAIAPSHYERLIEELKCPGCASPMKAPVLLCRTGHSSCEQCSRVLLLCPLCREPYTDMRSLTVEALCSKAHFRCANAAGGCTVRLHLDLLGWHEKQCIFKPMKCFMGRVWGDCQWSGREAYWKDHLTAEHGNKVFATDTIDLIWNMGVKQKPLTGYYVFEVFDEMFNFYEIFDKERVLFTMTVTSTVKDKKYNYAYEVTMLDRDSDALAITQKYPVHSEYDSDILQDGTCVSVPLTDLAKFIDEDRLLHYRVRITEVKTPRKMKLAVRHSCPTNGHPTDFQQTRIEGVNLKNVPTDVIVTRKFGDLASSSKASPNLSFERAASSSEDEVEKIRRLYYNRHNSDSDSDPELDAFIAKRWGTPQLHFNRKYLRNVASDISSSEDGISQSKNGDKLGLLVEQQRQQPHDDRASISSTATNYRKRMTNSFRRSMRTLRVDFKALTSKKSTNADKQPETA